MKGKRLKEVKKQVECMHVYKGLCGSQEHEGSRGEEHCDCRIHCTEKRKSQHGN